MNEVKLIPLSHNNDNQIAIIFDYNEKVKLHLKKLKDVKWSNTHKTFYIKYSSENKKRIYNHLRAINCYINYNELKAKKSISSPITHIKLPQLTEKKKEDLQKFKKWLQQKRLSENTVNTYFEVTVFFIKYASLKSTTNYSKRLIESFNYDFIVKPNKSISYQNQCINGIKKYLDYLGVEVDKLELKLPRKDKKLPVILSVEEIKQIFETTHNLKHKTLLSLIYSAGLRIGEAINLKIRNIDSKRMLIHVKVLKAKRTDTHCYQNRF